MILGIDDHGHSVATECEPLEIFSPSLMMTCVKETD